MGWNTHIPVKHSVDFHGHELLLQPRTQPQRVYSAPKLPIQIKRCSFELREIYAKCGYLSVSGSVPLPPLFERLLNSSFKLEPLAKNNRVTKSLGVFWMVTRVKCRWLAERDNLCRNVSSGLFKIQISSVFGIQIYPIPSSSVV